MPLHSPPRLSRSRLENGVTAPFSKTSNTNCDLDSEDGSVLSCQTMTTKNSTAFHQGRNAQTMLIEAFGTDNIDMLLKQVSFPTSRYIGVGISVKPYRNVGTKGFYLRIDGKTVAITCRHVVESNESLDSNWRKPLQATGCQPLDVVQLDQSQYEALQVTLKTYILRINEVITILLASDQVPNDVDHCKTFRAGLVSYLKRLQALGRPESRIIGSAMYASPLGSGTDSTWDSSTIHDWALIKLNRSIHEGPLRPPLNKVCATSFSGSHKCALSPREQLMAIMSEIKSHEPVDRLFGRRYPFVLRGCFRSDDFSDSETIVVGKVGNTTGLTFGVINPAFCIREGSSSVARSRRRMKNWAVVGPLRTTDGHLQPTRMPFSEPGDSGSCVWTLNGRILGMLTSGEEEQRLPVYQPDVTYITPIDRLLEDIRSRGFSVEDP